MAEPKVHRFLLLGGGLFLIVLDQLLKYSARRHPTYTWYIIDPWLGWELFLNPGIAFGLPFPNTILLIVTPLIVFGLSLCIITKAISRRAMAGLMLIIAGAISNYIDRMLFVATIDYIRIATSIINLADFYIVLGAILLIPPKKNKCAILPKPSTH